MVIVRGIQILRVSDFNYEFSKCLAMFNFAPNPGPLSFGLGPLSFFLGAQLAPDKKG